MRKYQIISALFLLASGVNAQTRGSDSVVMGKITVIKDNRLNELNRKEMAFNEAFALAPRSGQGYRLILLSTTDQSYAMQLRTQLLQRYPDQKAYTAYQSPYIKLKFGNFLTRQDADNMRKELLKSKLINGNIYIVAETIEIKPEKKDSAEND